MLAIGSIVWGVRDVPRAIAFWSAGLGYRPLRELSRDRSPQRARLPAPPSRSLRGRSGREVDRLLALGASRVEWRYPDQADDVVLADPDGNTFCVVQK